MTQSSTHRTWTMRLNADEDAGATYGGLSDTAMAVALRSLLFGGELSPPRSQGDRRHAARRRIDTRRARRAT